MNRKGSDLSVGELVALIAAIAALVLFVVAVGSKFW